MSAKEGGNLIMGLSQGGQIIWVMLGMVEHSPYVGGKEEKGTGRYGKLKLGQTDRQTNRLTEISLYDEKGNKGGISTGRYGKLIVGQTQRQTNKQTNRLTEN